MNTSLMCWNTDEGAHGLEMVLRVFGHLGVQVSLYKTEGPSTSLTFLGIVINPTSFELRLPTEKVQHLQSLIREWARKRACIRKELECLLGHLFHAASVACPGQTFLRQLFGLLHMTRVPNYYVCLPAGVRADLAWWKCFLQVWNGPSFFRPPHP